MTLNTIFKDNIFIAIYSTPHEEQKSQRSHESQMIPEKNVKVSIIPKVASFAMCLHPAIRCRGNDTYCCTQMIQMLHYIFHIFLFLFLLFSSFSLSVHFKQPRTCVSTCPPTFSPRFCIVFA